MEFLKALLCNRIMDQVLLQRCQRCSHRPSEYGEILALLSINVLTHDVSNLGTRLNKALRILTTEQKNWSSHLQVIAMSHRGSATTNLQLSPFEILYGRPMMMFCDASLLAETEDSPSLTAHRKEVAPKLDILYELAMQNAAESASKQRDKRNVGSVPPSYKIADKVLLHDTSTKIGDSAKWTKRWTGPFFVKEILPNYNYKLQCLKTGRDLKRSVHASRLRPLKTMLNDYRLPQPDTTRTLFESDDTESATEGSNYDRRFIDREDTGYRTRCGRRTER
jgi:hypothetical protein